MTRNTRILSLTKTAFASSLIFLCMCSVAFAQSAEREKPKIRDFGSSLKREKDRKSVDKSNRDKNASEEIIKVKTDLVVNDVLVLDEKGIWVKNLTKDDFVVTENGEAQDIQIFGLGDDAKIPRSIVLLIDHSISEVPFIVNSVMSAKILVDNLNPDDRMAIVTDNIELLCDFTHDKELLKEKLESLKMRMIMRNFGQSRQYSALLAAVNELFSAEDIRRIIIFQTDGDQINLKHKKFDFDEVKTAVEKSRSTIYSIFPGLRYDGLSEKEKYKQAKNELETIAKRFSNKTNFDLLSKNPPPEREDIISYYEKAAERQSALTEIAKSTGGRIEYLETPAQAEQIYSKILEEINNRYVIGYYPKNETKDGKRRIVKIEVKNHPEYQIEGRKTYFAEETDN